MNAPGGGPEDAGPSNTVAVDTSALVAIFLREEDPVDYGSYLHQHYCLIGWPTLVEFHRVMVSKTGDAEQREVLDYLEAQPNIRFVPFGPAHFRAAAAAFARFGKGRHPAALNYGDCMSYAVAKHAGVPILFKGNDFAQTDLASAVEIR